MSRDLRHAARTLARSPGYSLAVVLTLALGIGVTTAVLSAFRSVVLRPLAWAPSDRVMIGVEQDSAGTIRLPSYPTFEDWRGGTDAFAALAFARGLGTVLKTPAGAERVVGAYVTDEFFLALPERALAGRTLERSDWRGDAPAVAVLSHRLWQRRFGGDPRAVGGAVTLGTRRYLVVGVMPPGYGYPTWADFYAPISTIVSSDSALRQRGVHVDSRVVGRLRPGVDSAMGARSLSVVAARLAEAYPAENGGWRSAALTPVASEILGDIGGQLRLMSVAAAFVLLIGCVNIANLSLARTGARTRELAIRSALGGDRFHLLRTLAAESLLLGVAAGLVGLLLAGWLTDWIRVAGQELVPRADELAVDPRFMLASVAAALVIVVGFGLLPALRGAGSLADALRDGRGAGTGPARRRLRSALVVGELALALMLLAGAGLLVRSLLRLQEVRTGFDVDRLLAVPIEPPSPRYDDPVRARRLYEAAKDAVAALPGVRSVALTNHVPLSGGSMPTAIEIDGAPAGPGGSDQVLFREVDADYFRTAGIPVLLGRGLTPDDIRRPGQAALINQALARRYWPGRDPLGRSLTVFKSAQGRADFGEPVRVTVAGVVGDVRHFSLETDATPEVYLPYSVTIWPRMALLVRAEGSPGRLAPSIREAMRAVEPDLPLEGASLWTGLYELRESLRQSLAYRRFLTGLLVAFAVPALLLAALGIYGVVAYLVSLRTHEIGIRMALGAHRGRVVGMVLAEGLRLAVLGTLLGVAGAALTTRWLRAQLFEVTATDPLSFLAAAAVLIAVALVATLVPARRAARIDPARALQAE